MNNLNFSWIIEGKLAGHQAPSSERDLVWLKKQGIMALVRMAEKHKTEVTHLQINWGSTTAVNRLLTSPLPAWLRYKRWSILSRSHFPTDGP